MNIRSIATLAVAAVAPLAITACAAPATTVTATSPAAAQTTGTAPASSAPASSAPASSAPAQTVTTTAPASSAPASSAPASEAPSSKAPASSGGPQSKCSQDSQETAFQKAKAKLTPYEGRAWTMGKDAPQTYDPCQPLSWIAVTIEGGTGSSPWHILLFNHGEYVGTATAEPQGYKPQIVALSDAPVRAIQVTYRYNLPGESNAQASGKSVATFTWDEAQQKVVMTGNVPPKQ